MARRPEKYKRRADNRYHTSVSTGKFDENGKLIRIYLYADTSKELDAKVAETKYLVKIGKCKKPDKITVAEYAQEWYELYKSKAKLHTRSSYAYMIRAHITPAIGAYRLQNLTGKDCQHMINDRWDKPFLCHKLKMTMRQIEKSALRDKIITDPFWEEITMPPLKFTEKRALTKDEKKAITLADFTPMEKFMVYTLYGCGLRREELLALQKRSFDQEKMEVRIDHVIIYDGNMPVFVDETKTPDGVRIIPVPESLSPDIMEYVQSLKYDKDFLLHKTDINGNRAVKYSEFRAIWSNIVRKLNLALLDDDELEELKRLVREKKHRNIYAAMEKNDFTRIEGLSPYTFRHNYATMLYYSGISIKKAAKLMGHSDIKMIMRVYAHLDEEKENATERLNNYIKL